VVVVGKCDDVREMMSSGKTSAKSHKTDAMRVTSNRVRDGATVAFLPRACHKTTSSAWQNQTDVDKDKDTHGTAQQTKVSQT
tara:strand:+ start:124 stop:369 length:246 start_codon:yes stop_codon:yes gene_type:complete